MVVMLKIKKYSILLANIRMTKYEYVVNMLVYKPTFKENVIIDFFCAFAFRSPVGSWSGSNPFTSPSMSIIAASFMIVTFHHLKNERVLKDKIEEQRRYIGKLYIGFILSISSYLKVLRSFNFEWSLHRLIHTYRRNRGTDLMNVVTQVFALVDALVSRLPFRLSNEKNIVEETIDLFFFHVYTYMYTCAYVHVLFNFDNIDRHVNRLILVPAFIVHPLTYLHELNPVRIIFPKEKVFLDLKRLPTCSFH
ncbi:superoxide dismutase Cu-Zn-like isoform X1 [Vespula maculifrons]|uniref:Superoxide dismutase Cu-Zn-like isoform X1 n=1 Tax=Vespula maculifrons TaxID=7453 RepID=A0ABD2BUL8_VESMC